MREQIQGAPPRDMREQNNTRCTPTRHARTNTRCTPTGHARTNTRCINSTKAAFSNPFSSVMYRSFHGSSGAPHTRSPVPPSFTMRVYTPLHPASCNNTLTKKKKPKKKPSTSRSLDHQSQSPTALNSHAYLQPISRCRTLSAWQADRHMSVV